jgi:acyl carrier protein
MKEKIKNIVKDSLLEFNEETDDNKQLEVSENTILLDKKGTLDSLDFVTLVIIIESNIFDKLDKSITIVSEKAFSKKYSPFKDVESLIEFIAELLESEK